MRGLLAVLLLVATPAAAQQAPPPGQAAPAGADIIVQGNKDRDAQVRGFVRDLTELSGTDPIARFDWAELCPGVAGLSPALNAAIADRMRRVAEAAKVPLARPGCHVNALVLIASDRAAMIKELHRRHPAYFVDGTGEPVVIPKQPGPATAWHLGGYVDRDGQPLGYDSLERHWVLNSTLMPSHISATVRPVFFASVVVIDADAVIGLTATQVADYAAMRSFAGIDPERLRGSTAPTIVTILDAAPDSLVPLSLTEWDLAYLRALYAVPATRYGPSQRTEIRRRMIREMGKGTGGGGQ